MHSREVDRNYKFSLATILSYLSRFLSFHYFFHTCFKASGAFLLALPHYFANLIKSLFSRTPFSELTIYVQLQTHPFCITKQHPTSFLTTLFFKLRRECNFHGVNDTVILPNHSLISTSMGKNV